MNFFILSRISELFTGFNISMYIIPKKSKMTKMTKNNATLKQFSNISLISQFSEFNKTMDEIKNSQIL